MLARVVLVVLLWLCWSASASAATFHVDPQRGSDRASGSKARPLKTVRAAWNRIPTGKGLDAAYAIRLAAGTYARSSTPNYWEGKRGTAARPITITGPRRGTARLTSINMFGVTGLTLRRLTIRDRFDLFHCEQCSSVTLDDVRLLGSAAIQENVKINQSRRMTIRNSTLSGAGDNVIDMVAVDGALVEDNDISGAGDWCVYAKGGSADVVIRRNRVSRCGTGGITAGQGTGLQFMRPPFVRYEAYRVTIEDNDVSGIEGAAFGVNGAYQTRIVGNRAWAVGARSHWLEVVHGLRSCDGRPGDEGRGRCGDLLAAGAWGTTRVDDGDNAVRIPNRHVAVVGNLIANPDRRGDTLFSVAEPFSGPAQAGSGLEEARADDDLRVISNRFDGGGLPDGLTAATVAGDNDFSSGPLFASPVIGERLTPITSMPPAPSITFANDAPTAAEDG